MHYLLVLDIGGGTSDFSLFELRSQSPGSFPEIKREAVGEHVLLGGDNVDLAIAHLLEPRLIGEHGKLSGLQWDDLVARCRELKERVLSVEGRSEEAFSLSLPGRGSDLIRGSRTAQLTRAELETVLVDGFFPQCDAQAYPYRTQAALKEWGLSYASDCAVTRHLAEFLRGRPRVDAILFNGGALRPKLLRERICQQVGKWQGGSPLLEPEPADLELAVARGAALFGKSIHRKTERIEAGSARAVFLEVLREQSPELGNTARPSLICVLPRGALSEQRFEITGVPVEMQTNRLARFQAFSSPRHDGCKAGDIIEWNEESFRPLPPLETVIRLESGAGRTSDTIPIKLVASTNDLDLLHVSCVSADPRVEQSWPLEFNLRTREHDQQPLRPTAASRPVKPNIGPAPLAAAKLQTERFFARSANQRDPITAARVLKKLEQILGMPRGEWNAGLVRSLWAALETCMAQRKLSADHEESWLILAGSVASRLRGSRR
jgi:hypothetical protein